jgi:DNA-binding CsgD family transcriptional regulator
MPDADNHTVPVATYESWRAWLMTGARRTPVDKRRLRGAHTGLKKILLEGLTNGVGDMHRWHNFSGAMVRHAVDDAMRSLPPEDTKMVKLAYFGGYSNREIAEEVGVTEWTVRRRLRRALAAISEHIQTGRTAGRRVAYGLAVFFSGRWLSDHATHVWTATAVAGAAIVIVAAQPAPAIPIHQPAVPATQTTARPAVVVPPVVVPPVPASTVQVNLPAPARSIGLATVRVPAVHLPVSVPAKLKNLLYELRA